MCFNSELPLQQRAVQVYPEGAACDVLLHRRCESRRARDHRGRLIVFVAALAVADMVMPHRRGASVTKAEITAETIFP